MPANPAATITIRFQLAPGAAVVAALALALGRPTSAVRGSSRTVSLISATCGLHIGKEHDAIVALTLRPRHRCSVFPARRGRETSRTASRGARKRGTRGLVIRADHRTSCGLLA